MTPKTCMHQPWEKCPCAHVASLGGAAAVRMDPTIPAGLPADLRTPVDELIDELDQDAVVLDAKAQNRVLSSELRGRFATRAALTRGRAARLRAKS